MRTAKASRWVTLYRHEKGKLVIICEPLRVYKLHNLLAVGWKEVKM